MTGFSLQTLGFPEIHGDNGPIKLNLRKGLALLIYLAEAQGAVARDVIATLLWPESPRETARARLRRMLHRIELDARPACFRDRPHQRAVVSGGRTEGRFASVRERLRPRRFRGSLPDAIGVTSSRASLWPIVPSSTIGRSFAARRSGGGSCMGWNASCRTRMPPANILPRRLTRDASSSSIR